MPAGDGRRDRLRDGASAWCESREGWGADRLQKERKKDVDMVVNSVRLTCQSISQQYCSLILNQHQPPTTSQSAVLFSHNKSAPANSHSQANTAFNIHSNLNTHVAILPSYPHFLCYHSRSPSLGSSKNDQVSLSLDHSFLSSISDWSPLTLSLHRK